MALIFATFLFVSPPSTALLMAYFEHGADDWSRFVLQPPESLRSFGPALSRYDGAHLLSHSCVVGIQPLQLWQRAYITYHTLVTRGAQHGDGADHIGGAQITQVIRGSHVDGAQIGNG